MRHPLLALVLAVPASHAHAQEAAKLASEPVPVGTRLLDLDGDGALDLLECRADGGLSVRRNVGPRSFVEVRQELPAVRVSDVLLSDLDGDGRLDLYLVGPEADVALVGLGGGAFRAATQELGLGESGHGLSAERRDVDADGLLDLVVHNQGSDVLFWARADGRFEREELTQDGVAPTAATTVIAVPLPDSPGVAQGAPQASSGPGRTLGALATSGPSSASARVAAPAPPSSSAPLIALSLDARYVNDNQNEVDSADIVDGTLTGADISTSSGDVGVGTTAPSAKLEVVGETELNGVVNINGPAIEDTILNINNGNSPGGIYIAGSNPGANPGIKLHNKVFSENFRIRHNSSNQLSFQNSFSGLEIMTMSTGGNVGIGTLSPSFMLEVNGTAGKPGGGSWSTSSDRRLKKNIRDLEGALDTLLELRGVTFEYKDPDAVHELSGTRIGFIAQEVEEVLPDWVEEIGGYKRLTIRGFEALAVEALRELREENAALEARVAELEVLENELGQLRATLATLAGNR